ncbi:MAG: molybdenum cofactor guanylyltransferase [Schlesneria sp.]|nr:molybdenum cofactor guanylyltransferase [Schlesneria sp.]
MRCGAIILCGGKSSRMGQDKATLPFGPECMLQRVVRLISEVIPAANIVVVAAAEQTLPPLPPGIRVTHDEHQDRGPLEGLAAGLRCLGGEVDAVYVTSCDVPLLVPAFVTQMFAELGDYEIAVPCDQERLHPLAAVYRCTVLPQIERLLHQDQLRVRLLFDAVCTRKVATEELRTVDPTLSTLLNLNHPEDYRAALETSGVRLS